jgi:hypothetical protein
MHQFLINAVETFPEMRQFLGFPDRRPTILAEKSRADSLIPSLAVN